MKGSLLAAIERGGITGAVSAAIIAVTIMAAGAAMAQTPTATPTPGVIPKGSIAVSIGTGQVEIHNPDGSIQRTLNSGADDLTAGSAFDSNGDFFVTGFDQGRIDHYDPLGNFLGTFGSGFTANPESILFDAAGNMWVGQAQNPGGSTGTIFKFSSNGTPKAQFTVPVESRGTDWIDLAADQCTMHYTSEGVRILRYNVCTNKALSDFNVQPLPGLAAYAHRILSSGGELVADSNAVILLDSGGNQVQTYNIPNNSGAVFALNVDPDGTSFWTGDLGTGTVYRIDIASGTIISQFTTSNAQADGIGVKGEIVVGEAGAEVAAPAPTTVAGNPGQKVDAGTFTLTNTSSITETFTTVTLGLTDPQLISALDVSASFDETTSTGTSTSPSSSTVITMNPPIVLPGGAVAQFSVTATLAHTQGASAAPPNRPIKLASIAPADGGGGWIALVLSLIAVGSALIPGRNARARILLLAIIGMAFFATASQIGCDPCPSCAEKKPPAGSTILSVDNAAGTTPSGATVKVTGVPAQLSTITRQ